MATQPDPQAAPRKSLRAELLQRRAAFVASPAFEPAQQALFRHLAAVLEQLEPGSLGVYWPMRSEFNAAGLLAEDHKSAAIPWALPWISREPRQMHYRRWDRRPPTGVDECGIAACEGAEMVPEVVLAPCVGFNRQGFRLGYGGGYFDRWLAAHPHVTAIGVGWAVGEAEFPSEPHDKPMMAIVTEAGVIG